MPFSSFRLDYFTHNNSHKCVIHTIKRWYRQPQRSTGPKSQEGEFRVIQLTPTKTQRQLRKKFILKETLPPRYLRMSVDQDWTNIWPTNQTFKYSVVPLPITQGLIRTNKENKGMPLEKYANAELMKIPNFFHLTPNHIKKHCAAMKKFCTQWPDELKTDEDCQYYFPVEVTTNDYLYSGPSLRDSRARVVQFKFKLSTLELDEHARDKFLRLAGQLHNKKTDEITLIADKCPYRKQNYDYAQYLLTALFFESWKIEDWESEKTKADWERYFWEKSPSRTRLLSVLKAHETKSKTDQEQSTIDSSVLLEKYSSLADEYRENVVKIHDEGLENEDKNVNEYKQNVLKLYNLKL